MDYEEKNFYIQAFEGSSYDEIKHELVEIEKDELTRKRILSQVDDILFAVAEYKSTSQRVLSLILKGIALIVVGLFGTVWTVLFYDTIFMLHPV